MQEAGAQYAGWDGRFYHVPLLLGSISIFSQLLAPIFDVRPLFADNFSFESIYWLASCCLDRLRRRKWNLLVVHASSVIVVLPETVANNGRESRGIVENAPSA